MDKLTNKPLIFIKVFIYLQSKQIEMKLREYRLNEILSEIDNESIEVILDEGSKTINDWGFDTKHYFITVNIDVTETGTTDPGDHENEPEFNVDKTEINIELISIHLYETEIEISTDYKDKIVLGISKIIEVA